MVVSLSGRSATFVFGEVEEDTRWLKWICNRGKGERQSRPDRRATMVSTDVRFRS